MSARLPGEMDGRRFVRALRRLGWQPVRWRGSHVILVREVSKKTMTVAFHGTIFRAFARQILKDHGISQEDFLEVS